jgi:proteasome lid subunit RPN8/RPN11
MTIASPVVEDVVAHARDSRPHECCGLLLGQGDHIVTTIRARNIAEQPAVRFLIDPKDQIAARRTARDQQLDIVGFYHSHPHSRAHPSATDLAEGTYLECVHLIVGFVDGEPQVRVFNYSGGRATELHYAVVRS